MHALFHGDHQIENRKKFLFTLSELKQKNFTLIQVDGSNVDASGMTEAIESGGLFTTNAIVIENLFRQRSKSKLKEICEYLNSLPDNPSIILIDDKKLTATELKSLSNFIPTLSTITPVIFRLCDSLNPISGKLQHSLQLLEEALKTEDATFIVIMIARHVKLLLKSLTSDSKLGWQQQKLAPVATGIGYKKLTEIYHQIYLIDFNHKTGQHLSNLKLDLATLIRSVYVKKV